MFPQQLLKWCFPFVGGGFVRDACFRSIFVKRTEKKKGRSSCFSDSSFCDQTNKGFHHFERRLATGPWRAPIGILPWFLEVCLIASILWDLFPRSFSLSSIDKTRLELDLWHSSATHAQPNWGATSSSGCHVKGCSCGRWADGEGTLRLGWANGWNQKQRVMGWCCAAFGGFWLFVKKKSATIFGLDFAWTIHDGDDDDDDDDEVGSSWTQPLASHFSDGPNTSRIIKILSSESSPKNQNGFVRFFSYFFVSYF